MRDETTVQIKLKAWDESNKVMHSDFQFIASGEEGNDWIVFTSDKQKLTDEPHPFQNPYFRQQLNIRQYTGSSTATEDIYTGDFVHIDFMDSDEKVIATETCVALWEEGRGAFTFAPSTKHRGLDVDGFFKRYREEEIQFIRWVSIIGNIFENPELDLVWEQEREKQFKNNPATECSN
jgi:hypothetical protein